MSDHLFRGTLEQLDPDVYELTQLEAERQARKLILIPSESQAPLAVRDAMGSAFQNIYAEGYPNETTRFQTQEEILDYACQLTHYRRYADPRYYKGVEYADLIESLAIRRCAEAFAANGVAADQIHVNVQALSGAPANNAVYHALVKPGDTVMGMNLFYGGHLSHGSPVNRSGKYFNIVPYTIDPVTQQIDYDAVMALAKEHKPKMIIAGYSSYPWIPDWKKYREIADAAGAYLLADIAHIGGLVAAGVVPSPIGYADVITSTTHKTLHGPRGAIIMTTDKELAKLIDKAVFPGEQGGPHVHIFAALALTFKLARTPEFKVLQEQTIKNAVAMADQLKKRGLTVPYGGTNSHLLNIDCRTIKSPDGTTLSGDRAVRILDLVGIVANRNTIPGDTVANDPSGVRLGTPWITQRGFDEAKSRQLADIIADVLLASAPHRIETPNPKRIKRRAKIDFNIFEEARLKVRAMAESAGVDFKPTTHGYPHFFYVDDKSSGVFDIEGFRVRQFLNYTLTSDVSALKPGDTQATRIITPRGAVDGALTCVDLTHFRLSVPAEQGGLVGTWLRDHSDGYTSVRLDGQPDYSPVHIPGLVIVADSKEKPVKAKGEPVCETKPYYIGVNGGDGKALPDFQWEEKESPLRRTALYEVHKQMGAKIIPFAGWEMPVWYSSVLEEHLATRQAAGLFDVSHMGVYHIEGADAAAFLDSVVANDAGKLRPGNSLYTHFLTPDAKVIDDTLIYRRADDKYLMVVNASNDDKDRAWLEAVRDGKVKVDNARPWARTFGYNAVIRNLRDPKEGKDMRIDIALQGPRSTEILLALGADDLNRRNIRALKRTQLCDAKVGTKENGVSEPFDLIVSRTGYTGEKVAYELFVHPERAVEFWQALLRVGEKFGLKAVGLGARDSLRTEAGLPLYGHEMGDGSGKFGQPDLGVGESGFIGYVKFYKPWFIGRDALIASEEKRKGVVARFRFAEKGVRMAHNGDPVLDKRGKVVGWVTSCAVDAEGYLTGQAYVELKSAEVGAQIFIYQSAPKDASKAPAELKSGDKVNLPTPAVVVSRFPM
ncbi:MAG: glycine cleavage system aminomethyltransferase GcvT [Chloroflexi bacterium]|nr:glycine cleavage system aminomethyltransferase GcvT [Chloroflexota bacterium]MCA2001775.1 glycine cleavage system aminomethyltransferase GcvT [Chloroflexota bacterium]